MMTKTFLAFLTCIGLIFSLSVAAEGNLAKQVPIELRIDLGKDESSEHRFHPDTLTLETGKLYKLVIHNPSDSKHYFTSPGFVSKIYTRKVQVMDDLGAGAKQISEIKGAISEVEVYPGGTSEWWFVPVANGKSKLYCHIKDQDGKTHTEKGMEGLIIIN
jgi:uncharacterized cupredoxin-like copper-binding protein